MTLKGQAINGVLWKSVGTFSSLGIEFIVGIMLARLLTPTDFGLVGTITVVIVISQIFINSGFSQAIVRKQDCTQKDYSTAFFFNLLIGVCLFLLLIFTARPISKFFNNPDLKPLIQVLGIGLVIGSLTLIQQAILVKRIDFKLQARIAVIASFLSGLIAIVMAFRGFGVWSLVAKSLFNQGIISGLLWYYNRWRPDFIFDTESFRELFRFGSKLLLSGLLGSLFSNIYYIFIAKYFSTLELGYYTRAELFKNFPSQNMESIITSVGYPILARVQDDPVLLNAGFRKILTTSFFIIAVLMFGLAAIADSMIITLIGEQWRQSVAYLRMLCFVGLLFPLNSININLLNVVGRSDLYLKLQLIPQILTVPTIILGVSFGIKIMIACMCINSVISFFCFSHVASKFSRYTMINQLKDILPDLLVASLMGALIYCFDFIFGLKPFLLLLIQILTGACIVILAGEVFNLKTYMTVKEIVLEKVVKKYKIN